MYVKETHLLNIFSLPLLATIEGAEAILTLNKTHKQEVEQLHEHDFSSVMAKVKPTKRRSDEHVLLPAYRLLQAIGFTDLIPAYSDAKVTTIKHQGNYRGVKYRLFHPCGELAMIMTLVDKGVFNDLPEPYLGDLSFGKLVLKDQVEYKGYIPPTYLGFVADSITKRLMRFTNDLCAGVIPESNLEGFKFSCEDIDVYLALNLSDGVNKVRD